MEVPSTIFILVPSLKHLGLAQNNISTVPFQGFNGAFMLEELLLNANVIRNISSSALYELDRLSKLKLDDNKLQTFGEECSFKGVKDVKEFI